MESHASPEGVDVPTYKQLLARDDAPPGSSWRVFGDRDELGTANFLSPSAVVSAANLIRRGQLFSLDYPLDAFDPSPIPARKRIEHRIFQSNSNHRDDWLDSFYLQSTSQIDALRHIRHPRYGFYGGVADSAIDVGKPSLGIQNLASPGVAGRGVLLDCARYHDAQGTPLAADKTYRISATELREIASWEGVELRRGDVVIVRTGWSEHFLALDHNARADMLRSGGSPGLDQSEDILEWAWDSGIALLACDNVGVEAKPVRTDGPFYDPEEAPPAQGTNHNGMLHRPIIALLGVHLGELWRVGELAADCAEDGRYEFFICAKPLVLVGGVGSPPNGLAIK